MNILHVLSQFEVTGAEVYAITLASAQQRLGHSVLLVSDTLHIPFNCSFISQPIGKRSYLQRLRNIGFLIRLIREKNIHIVHGHSRAASWVCNLATLFTGIPFVSTIHGRQHLHLSSKSWSVYGTNIIAVSESLREHLVHELHLDPKYITTIPNGFETQRWISPVSTQSSLNIFGVPSEIPILLFIGRFSGPKGDIVRFLVSEVYPEVVKKTPCSLQIIGGLYVPEDIPQRVQQMQKRFGKTSVVLREFQTDLIPFLRAANVVIGAGRVVMESLMVGKPTIAFGESDYEGLVTLDNYEAVRRTNFGDTGIRQIMNAELVVNDLTATLNKPQTATDTQILQKRIQETCDIDVVEKKINAVYQSAVAAKKSPVSIPVLMYHRIVPEALENSHHGIWVTALSFEQNLISLKQRGISPITFEQYQLFLNGEFTLPKRPVILTFDDGYEDNYTHAFPLLKKYEFSAVIFLVTDKTRRTNFWDANEPQEPLMNNEQIREISLAGIEFGSHTVTHPNLSQCSPEQIRTELVESKQIIEHLTGKEIISLAYPYGAVNELIKSITAEIGYKYGIATNSGPRKFYEDLFEIRRTQIFPWTDRFGFWKKTQQWYLHYKQRKSN
ncbi:MAG: polysaccharide deacetylase family protein [Bacteroidota bacterium]|jgi:peptidoglycan/xylan/chitin deacetylase (PgdA/CDA1 family)/glycosyltransferase involved in cell wall biosynthesis